VSCGLPSVFFRHSTKKLFAECQIKTLGKKTLGKEIALPSEKKHSAKSFLPSAKKTQGKEAALPSAKKHSAKKVFAECFFHSAKQFFKAHFEP
jgi:hypothetical protein